MKLIRLIANRAIRCAACVAALGFALPGAAEPAYAPAMPGTEYRINVGDELDVLVWGDERMQRAVRVQPDGTFSFPLAGVVMAAGIAPRDVSLEIQRRLADKYRNGPPDVTVTVRDPEGMRFFVLGKVRTPGSYAAGGSVNIVQALSMAGGLAEFADVKKAIILRRTSEGQVVERVKLAQVLKGSGGLRPGALADPLPVLRSGDVLVIP